MNKKILMNFQVDKENKKINAEREFDAPLDLVWQAWTDSEILDQWWAPKPWKTQTKSMDFTEGGRWHYAMLGPQGEKQWCLLDYHTIVPYKRFSGLDAFCDEQGNITADKPRAFWENVFTDHADTTRINIEIKFDALSDLETIIEMGLQEGFTMALENLDHYISMLRK